MTLGSEEALGDRIRLLMAEKLDMVIQVHHLIRKILHSVSGHGKLLLMPAVHCSLHLDSRVDRSFLRQVDRMILLCTAEDPEATE